MLRMKAPVQVRQLISGPVFNYKVSLLSKKKISGLNVIWHGAVQQDFQSSFKE
jgi:hypothetical protein